MRKVTPIYKAGGSSDLGSYRPISALLCFSKILERIIYNRVYTTCKKIKFFTTNNSGSKEETQSIMLSFICKYTLSFFIDLFKASDH